MASTTPATYGPARDPRVAQAPARHEHLHDLGATGGHGRDAQNHPSGRPADGERPHRDGRPRRASLREARGRRSRRYPWRSPGQRGSVRGRSPRPGLRGRARKARGRQRRVERPVGQLCRGLASGSARGVAGFEDRPLSGHALELVASQRLSPTLSRRPPRSSSCCATRASATTSARPTGCTATR
jgi:hypothetical protein